MQPVVNKFYDLLKEGKIMGVRCNGCGRLTFPPLGLCPECGRHDVSWVPISGRGKLLFASAGAHRMMGVEFLQATVKLEEGLLVSGMLLDDGFDLAHPEDILKYYGKINDVTAEIRKNPEGVEAVVFRIVK